MESLGKLSTQQDEIAFANEVAESYMKEDDERVEKSYGVKKQTAYTRIATRFDGLDDAVLAAYSRLLIEGRQMDVPRPLPNALCSLLLSEAARCPVTFLISLMLLDLIETRTTYGKDDHQKQYTWKSMLMHDNAPLLPVPGRGAGTQSLGKHPMAGGGTVTLGSQIATNSEHNMTRDRIVSIASIWLAHFLAKRSPASPVPYFIVKSVSGAWVQNQAPKPDKGAELVKGIRGALQARACSASCLIGGTKVLYVDLKGMPA
jgi:hypothetical protein